MGRASRLQEPLMTECTEERLGEGFVVTSRIAEIGEYLRQSLFIIDTNKFLILRQLFLLSIEFVYMFGRIVSEDLMMDNGLQGKSVGQGWTFVRPTQGKGGYWHDQFG